MLETKQQPLFLLQERPMTMLKVKAVEQQCTQDESCAKHCEWDMVSVASWCCAQSEAGSGQSGGRFPGDMLIRKFNHCKEASSTCIRAQVQSPCATSVTALLPARSASTLPNHAFRAELLSVACSSSVLSESEHGELKSLPPGLFTLPSASTRCSACKIQFEDRNPVGKYNQLQNSTLSCTAQ
jgi:hypothetical protein